MIAVGVFSYLAKKRRREGFARVASRQGLSFADKDPFSTLCEPFVRGPGSTGRVVVPAGRFASARPRVKARALRVDRSSMADLIWIAIALGVAVVVAWRFKRHHDRRRQLMLLCHRASLEFSTVDPFPDTGWLPFRLFGRGLSRGIENVVWNNDEGEGARAFDYWIEERRTDDSVPVVHRFSCALVALPVACRRLVVAPHGIVDDVRELTEGDDLDLELGSFNRRFDVHADERRFAVTFLDQRMMRALMTLPDGVTVLVNEDRMLLVAPVLSAPEVLLLLEAARALRRHVPAVVASLYPPRPMKGPHEDRWLQGGWSPEPIGDDADPARSMPPLRSRGERAPG